MCSKDKTKLCYSYNIGSTKHTLVNICIKVVKHLQFLIFKGLPQNSTQGRLKICWGPRLMLLPGPYMYKRVGF